MKTSPKLLAYLQIATAIGIALFWASFFISGMHTDGRGEVYLAYELSFPFPDTILSISLLIGSIFLLKERRLGVIISLAAGGALIFLGLVDFSFNIQNGIYDRSLADGLVNGFINLWSLSLGSMIVIVLSRKNNTWK